MFGLSNIDATKEAFGLTLGVQHRDINHAQCSFVFVIFSRKIAIGNSDK
jgi:hypothetical protein